METAKERIKRHAKLFVDANVWDGEDRSGAVNDCASFNPDELQELFDEFIDDVFDRPISPKQGV